jgi:hypothetical protein
MGFVFQQLGVTTFLISNILVVGNLIHRVFALLGHPFSKMLQMAWPPSPDIVMHWLEKIFQFGQQLFSQFSRPFLLMISFKVNNTQWVDSGAKSAGRQIFDF